MATTIVSSPGKVLLAGGYLVLDPAYSGVVVSTSSRFYAVIRDEGDARGAHRIRVRSPQFVDATWVYAVEVDESTVRIEQTTNEPGSSSSKNKFVHLAIQRTLSLALEVRGAPALKDVLAGGLDIAIVGDNDFYSQRAQLQALGLEPVFSSLSELTPFSKTNVRLSEVHKTGLGSSAALITSLVSALLVQFSVIPRTTLLQQEDVMTNSDRQLAHNLAQYIHCYAQGKVGSGFDVAAAVFGSQVYTRFKPDVIQPLMGEDSSSLKLLPIISPSNKAWDYRVESFKLPPLTRLMLADVDAGSDTPSLVGKVLKWRQADTVASHQLWEDLNKTNQALCSQLLKLTDLHSQNTKAYSAAVRWISSLQPLQWLANPNTSKGEGAVVEAFYHAHQITQDIRSKMRQMGKLSDVPIEPPEQTSLLEACVAQAGVIGGGVPGAGGYDAVWLLVCDPAGLEYEQKPVYRVGRIWHTWKDLVVTPLSASESMAKGVRLLENIDEVPGLKDATAV
ncbi:Phosphomevalonate kinase [Neolentinus lepideus HHB14362 ss-1]|uniref:Phosphomevalonate kinase n=1 Tax=Neolentinus lepideus HHB14362 ss-1 TaxID=1314782 RepID=A0A165TJ77_9AGAM|nr:Phosphomevalonate kinase [Neolentinus lepideus HHB14362 ss-1]